MQNDIYEFIYINLKKIVIHRGNLQRVNICCSMQKSISQAFLLIRSQSAQK